MENRIPQEIKDLKLVFINEDFIDARNVSQQIGKFFVISKWISSTFKNLFGMMVYDCYILAWVKESDNVYFAIYFEQVEPRGTIDMWNTTPILRGISSDFNLEKITECIRSHRLIK